VKPAPYRIAPLAGKPETNLTLADVGALPLPARSRVAGDDRKAACNKIATSDN